MDFDDEYYETDFIPRPQGDDMTEQTQIYILAVAMVGLSCQVIYLRRVMQNLVSAMLQQGVVNKAQAEINATQQLINLAVKT